VLATTAAELGAVAEPCDVTDADALRDLIEAVEAEHGPIAHRVARCCRACTGG